MASIAQMIRDGIGSLRTTTVEVKEWECSLELQELTGTLLETWEQKSGEWVDRKAASKIDVSMRAVLIGLSIVDEQRARPFSDKAGFTTLSGAAGHVLDTLYYECLKLNKLGRFGGDDADEEDDVKKPEDDQESDSGES